MHFWENKAEKQLIEIRNCARNVVLLGREPHRDTYIIGRESVCRLYDAIFGVGGNGNKNGIVVPWWVWATCRGLFLAGIDLSMIYAIVGWAIVYGWLR